MVNYQEWNDYIFKYCFLENIKNPGVIFYVNTEIINTIGSNMGIVSPMESFCKCVLNKIAYPKRDGKKWHIRLNDVSTNIYKEIPQQTAVIAFFILAASLMFEDKKYDNNSYWPKLRKLASDYNLDENQTLYQKDSDTYLYIFNSFAEYVSKKYNIVFKFSSLYNRKNCNDYIGLPISQTMVSDNDKNILYQRFWKLRNQDLTQYDLESIMEGNNYSIGFRKIRDSKNIENKESLKTKIKEIYEFFKIERDEGIISLIIDEPTGRKRKSIFIPKLYYEKKYGKFEFYEIIKNSSNFEDSMCINNKTYYRKDDHYIRKISADDISLLVKNIIANNNSYYEKEFIMLKKDDDFGYEEVFSANIGDTISIISTPSYFLNKLLNTLSEIANKKIIPIELTSNHRLYIAEGIVCKTESNFFNIKDSEAIYLKKGLKNRQKDEYLQGAEPIMYIHKKSGKSGFLTYEINNSGLQKYEKPVPLNKYNELGIHHIKTRFGNKEYKITDQFDENEQVFIYSYFDNYIYSKDTLTDKKINLVNGCFIENLKLNNTKCISKQDQEYIETILKAIYKKNNINNNYKQNFRTNNIGRRYLLELEK